MERDRYMRRTARLIIDVTFRDYDTTDEDDAPYYATENLVDTVMGWIEGAVNDRDDSPSVKLVLSGVTRRMVDQDGKCKTYGENNRPRWEEIKR